MILRQTKLLNKTTQSPTQLDILGIRKLRDPNFTKEDNRNLYYLEAGLAGENAAIDFIERFGRDHWQVIRNLYMNYYGSYETDITLLTNHGSYAIEVKNYSGLFQYENGQSRLRGNVMNNDCIAQTGKVATNLKNICHEVSPAIEAKGVLVFIGEHNQVEINSPVNHIEIVRRNRLRDFLYEVAEDENSYRGRAVNTEAIIRQFEAYETINPFGAKSLTFPEIAYYQKGVYCLKCHSFDIIHHKHEIECACGFKEDREAAVLRTLCEYGVLTFAHDLRRRDVQDFLNNQVCPNYLIKIFKKHFNMLYAFKNTRYENKTLPLYQAQVRASI